MFLSLSFANSDVLRSDAIKMLKNFNPTSSIPGFNANPKEANIGANKIKDAAHNCRLQNEIARFINTKEKERTRTSQNHDLSKLDNLIENNPNNTNGIACSFGECDKSKADVSIDINDGIGKLGAISETAQEITKIQPQQDEPAIFKGKYLECEKYLLGARDCCTDKGSLNWLIHCPRELQSLQKAKQENRAVYLGHYKPRRISTTRYGYCIFPTRLAAILQIEGRQNQLKVGFGSARHPNCRGISTSEIARINFSALNIEPLVADLLNKKDLPSNNDIQTSNQTKINKMQQKEQAYD